MPIPAHPRRLSAGLSVIAVITILALTAGVWLPRVSSAREQAKPGRRGAEKLREIAERKLRRPGGQNERPSSKQESKPTAQRPAASPFADALREPQDKDGKLEWPSFKSPRMGAEEEEEGYDKPREAAQYFMKKRLPKGEKQLPVEEYFKAREKMRTMPQFSSPLNRFLTAEESASLRLNKAGAESEAMNAAGWTQLGPGNIGGRTRAILIHPQDPSIMYAAGVSGGVWKSTDAGATWSPVADLIGNITVSSMAMEPGNPNVIYVGTGEGVYGYEYDGDLSNGDFRGAGIFKTTDGGANWARIAATNTEDFYFVNKITVSTSDKNHIYAATGTGVMRSLDGGATWSKVLDPQGPRGGLVNAGCLDLAMRTDTPADVVFASCGNFEQATVYRNTDAAGAGTWEPVLSASGMGRTALAIAPSNQEIIYALASSVENNQYAYSLYAVFRSTSGGAAGSWNEQVRNTNANKLNRAILSLVPFAIATDCGLDTDDGYSGQGWYDLTIAIDPLDPNRVWVGGIEIFRSDDGGVNWGLAGPGYDFSTDTGISVIHPDQHTIVFHPKYDGAGNQTLYIGNDGGLFRTDNARGPVLTTPASACQPSQVGVKWKTLNNNYGVTQFYHGAVSADGKSYIGGTQDNGTLLGTDEKGANAWRLINGGDGAYTAIDQSNSNILFGAYAGGMYFRKSTDTGGTFGDAAVGLNDDSLFVAPLAMDPSDSQRLWTGGYYLWRTTSSAAQWERASAITAGDDYVSAVAIAPTDSNRMLVGMGDGYVLRNSAALTSTSNTSWQNTQIRIGFISSLTFDPTNKDVAYATFSTFGGGHVWRTIDGGATWSAIDRAGTPTGLPDIPVHTLAVDPSNTSRLYVGTDVGVFVTNDGGQNWAQETTGFANVITEHLEVRVTNGVTWLYAFTHGRGVWRTMINNSGCSYALTPATRTVGADASGGTVTVKAAPNGCNWTAASNASWLRVTGGGASDGTANFEVDANSGFSSRTATATIAGRSFTIIQPGRTDVDAPTLAITDPAGPQTVPNASGIINLAGTASDNNAVTAVTWQSDRGASGTAQYTASTGRWTAANVPLSPGSNLITVSARDAAGNIARRSITLAAVPPAVLVTVAGTGISGATGDGGPAALAQITRAIRLDIDGAGNIYFTDSDNHTVRKITPAGVISTIAGRAGARGSSGDGGPATSAQLNFPIGVAVDGSGNVYICDSGNNLIRKVTAATGVISTIAGTGTAGSGGDGGPATAAQINAPQNVAVDKNGNVYISDFTNNRVRRVNAADGVISTVAGTGQSCAQASGACGDGGAATAAQLTGPNNVSVDKDGNLIICDPGNFRIRKVTVADGKIATIVGRGEQGFSGDGGPALEAKVSVPVGAVVDANGNLYFSDRGNQRVRRVDAATNIITTIVGSGAAGFNGDGLAPLGSNLNFPTGLALDPANNLYIGDRDNSRIRRLLFAAANDAVAPTVAITSPTNTSTFTTSDGTLNLSGTAADNQTVFQVRWSNDRGGSGVAAGTNSWVAQNITLQAGPNNLTVTAWDVNGNAASAKLLVMFNPNQIINTFAGTGATGNTGDGGPAVAARLFFPSAVATDATGNVYIADTINHRVRKVTPAGVILPFAGSGMLGSSGDGGQALDATMNQPQGLAVDAGGNVYIADTGNNRVRRVAPTGVITTFAGTGVQGFGGDGGPAAQAQLSLPNQIALDSAGNLYIADNGNLRVRKVTASTGVITTFAGNGQVGNGGNGGPATAAQFLYPTGVTVDRNGVVYILDSYDNRVRRVGTDGVISSYVGTGNYGYSGDGGPATAAEIDPLSYLATDADNNLYIADYYNHVIRKVTAATGIITTVVGTSGGFSGDGAAPKNAQLAYPNDLTFDRAGNMYIADLGNQRVRKVFTASALKAVASVSAASFLGDGLASELIAAGFGSNLATSVQVATSVPLPTALGDTTVRVRDAQGVERLAPLFFVAPTQVNFLIPSGTASGAATISITGGDGTVSTGVAQIGGTAPGLFSANADGQGVAAAVVFRLRANGEQVFEAVTRIDPATNRAVAVPIDLGPEGDQVFLVAYGTGWRFLNSLEASSASVGGAAAELLFAGPQGGFVGLDQANIRLNRNLAGRGDVDVKLTIDGKPSNTVRINIK